MKDVIKYKNFLTSDVNITCLKVDNISEMVEITSERGVSVDTIIITMETARDIGFINFQALEKVVRKPLTPPVLIR